ncbi:MAG: hypothetical protein LUQ04_09200 [Methanoregula sp.]|nr:hypothetical protein [Methanoregula sp.]
MMFGLFSYPKRRSWFGALSASSVFRVELQTENTIRNMVVAIRLVQKLPECTRKYMHLLQLNRGIVNCKQ